MKWYCILKVKSIQSTCTQYLVLKTWVKLNFWIFKAPNNLSITEKVLSLTNSSLRVIVPIIEGGGTEKVETKTKTVAQNTKCNSLSAQKHSRFKISLCKELKSLQYIRKDFMQASSVAAIGC